MGLNQYMEKAFAFEESGYVEEAVQLCLKCVQAFPEYENEILFEIAKMNYRNGKAEEALRQFLTLYELTGDHDIINLVIDAYYYNQEYAMRYHENCSLLENYPYFFGDKKLKKIEQIRFYPLFTGENQIYYFDKIKQEIKTILRLPVNEEKLRDCICLAEGLLYIDDILVIEKHTRKMNPLFDNENSLLLVYQEETWELFLQLADILKIALCDRIFLFDSLEELKKVLTFGQLPFPELLISNDYEKLKQIITDTSEKQRQIHMDYMEELCRYYKDNDQNIIRHIEEGKPNILFITSRYTTALQYHIRDCKEAAERLGMDTALLIEPNRFEQGVSLKTVLQTLMELKPDIVFLIDHFRFEYDIFLKLEQVIFIAWIQDFLPNIMNVHTPEKLGSRDIVLNHFITWKDFQKIGYDTRRVIDAPVPADANIYKKYELTVSEKEKYSCDICFVCHAADVDGYLKKLVENFPEEYQNMMYEIYYGYKKYVFLSGNLFETKYECKEFIKGALWQNYSIKISEEMLNDLANEMYLKFNEVLYRQALVEWLLEAGYDNIKLWGNGWVSSSKYAKYAMGPAENGKTLSKIYQSSKIVVGNNCLATGAARAWESMLSGAFYMSNYIPEEEDAADIRKIMKENEELVIYHGKEDFLNKIEYYLTHNEERQRMAEIGHKAALERMTYDIMMKRVIMELPEKLK